MLLPVHGIMTFIYRYFEWFTRSYSKSVFTHSAKSYSNKRQPFLNNKVTLDLYNVTYIIHIPTLRKSMGMGMTVLFRHAPQDLSVVGWGSELSIIHALWCHSPSALHGFPIELRTAGGWEQQRVEWTTAAPRAPRAPASCFSPGLSSCYVCSGVSWLLPLFLWQVTCPRALIWVDKYKSNLNRRLSGIELFWSLDWQVTWGMIIRYDNFSQFLTFKTE